MINSSRCYRYCIVPMCQNTSIKTPGKTFIQVPRSDKRRKLWFSAVRRDPKDFSKTSCVSICEDHFDLENDMDNYVRWKMMGGCKLMKRDAVPHKFECQKRKLMFLENHKDVAKRKNMQEIEEALSASSARKIPNIENISDNLPEVPKVEDILEVSQIEPKTKDVGVTTRPYYRYYESKQTQTVNEVVSRSCSPFACASTSVGPSPRVKKK